LEEVVQAAISKGFDRIALTEHIHRPEEDFYPEEVRKCEPAVKTMEG
jgi:histidinol-phosphatase (PHP family)